MSSKWHQKKAKQAELEFEKQLLNAPDDTTKDESAFFRDVAMGGGDVQVFEKKLSKDEKKAQAKAKREAKKKMKSGSGSGLGGDDEDDDDNNNNTSNNERASARKAQELLQMNDGTSAGADGGAAVNSSNNKNNQNDGIDHEAADALAASGTICTFAMSRKGVDHRSRDINVTNFTLQHMGAVLLDETEIVLNHGNRYGLIARNGAGKSTLLRAIGHRAIPIPNTIDLFFLSEEVEPSDTVTALDAVMSVDAERLRLEQQAEDLNQYLAVLADKIAANLSPEDDADNYDNNDGAAPTKSYEEQQEDAMDVLTNIYERLDALDAATAEVRARSILAGLGFTHEMQSKHTKDFSGGWRMRVSLARALFIQPMCLLLDEPTNHLDMEAVIWLEDYLSKWNRILLLVSHSQDFLNNVCTHIIHLTKRKKLEYYDGNYDQFMKTKSEKEENQLKQYKWEQEQIKSMKEYIARFGHGTAKNAKQAQSKEKVLAKMIRAGLTEKPEEEKPMNFKFNNPGHLPPPVLAFHDVSFAYPNCQPLYTNVNFGIDLDSRVALVGPNGAGKTTLIKLMAGELIASRGDIRPHGHLKLGRFTQHFVDVLNLDLSPLDFFEQLYPSDPREEQRKYLGRFGISGKMQVQKMSELSDGQKSRVVFAKLGRDTPHILLLDEPTNHLDMESIDALAKAINDFEGGLVLVSHDMRLISQVAKEIWICDHKTITKYSGDIQNFKMDMRAQMGIGNETDSSNKKTLRGDASVKQKSIIESTITDTSTVQPGKNDGKSKASGSTTRKKQPSLVAERSIVTDDESDTKTVSTTASSVNTFSNTTINNSNTVSKPAPVASVSAPVPGRYIPPHLRKKMLEEQNRQQNQ